MLALFVTGKLNDTATEDDVSLTDMDPASINTIKIIRRDTDEIVFQKETGKWWMLSPYHMPANEVRINTILNLPGAHSYTQFGKGEVELDRFLLNDPAVSIEFNNTRIDFGDTNPIAEQRYVLANETVHLINDSLYQQLQTPATFFLGTKLLPDDRKIRTITFPDYTVNNDKGVWTVEPEHEDIAADNIVKLIHAWHIANAISIRDIGAAENYGAVQIELDDDTTIEFIIINPLPQLILARPDIGLQYHISSYDAEILFLQPITNHESPVTN